MCWPALSSITNAQTVWSDLTFSFSHTAVNQAQDEISPNVWLTRGSSRGLFNAADELGYTDFYSPKWTLWATEVNNSEANVTATNWQNLTFEDWQTAYGGPGTLADSIVGSNAVLYLELDAVYLDIQFTSWGQGPGAGGAFSYLRAEPPALEPTGDYNGDNIVDAADYTVWRDTLGQVVPNGSGADGDADGTINPGDYEFWKGNFGNLISPGAGGVAAIPEPTTVVLIVVGALTLVRWRRR